MGQAEPLGGSGPSGSNARVKRVKCALAKHAFWHVSSAEPRGTGRTAVKLVKRHWSKSRRPLDTNRSNDTGHALVTHWSRTGHALVTTLVTALVTTLVTALVTTLVTTLVMILVILVKRVRCTGQTGQMYWSNRSDVLVKRVRCRALPAGHPRRSRPSPG